MKLYIAGPMTGYPAFNYPAFDAFAAELRQAGHEVISPAELDQPAVCEVVLRSSAGDLEALLQETGLGHANFLARDIQLVASDAVEGIAVLPGWEFSKGARLEVTVALGLGKPVLNFDDRADLIESDDLLAAITPPKRAAA